MNADAVSADARPSFSRSVAFSRTLRSDSPVALIADECLRLSSRYSDCERCAEACPARVLCVSASTIDQHDGCLRCGRCAAACPTAALHVDGFAFEAPRVPLQSRSNLYIDCWKVPASETPCDALRVPCLAGIATHDFVQLYSVFDGAQVRLLDRGWCDACSVRGRGAAQETLSAARDLLSTLGVPEEHLPRFEHRPLPCRQMPEKIPQASAAQPLTRREFLRGMTRNAARTLVPLQSARRDTSAGLPEARRVPTPSIIRSRLLAQAAVIAAQHGRALPGRLYPAVRILDACRNHQVCAAACPTRALQAFRTEDGTAAGIAFDAAVCIACGDCTRACPEAALTLTARGDDKAPHGAAELTRWIVRECVDCGFDFADSGSANICPACRKTRDLAGRVFSALLPPGCQPHSIDSRP